MATAKEIPSNTTDQHTDEAFTIDELTHQHTNSTNVSIHGNDHGHIRNNRGSLPGMTAG